MGKRIEVKAGDRYGRLTVVVEVEPFLAAKGRAKRRFRCQCECGRDTTVRLTNLRSGKTSSCGCLQSESRKTSARTHGQAGSLLHGVWKGIKRRCYNPNSKGYERYGGRGIQTCQRWRVSFEAFLKDLGPRPSDNHSVERINNDGHYSCGHCLECLHNGWEANCKWATSSEQCRNTRVNRKLTHDGKTMCVVEWSEETGIGEKVIRRRLSLGWSVADTLVTPVGERRSA